MDQILSVLVRFMVFLSGFAKPAAKLGIGCYEERKPGEKLKLLLVGYNGARNTGADARVVAIVDQLRALFGPEQVRITVMTLDKKMLEGYFAPDVELLEFSSVFLWDLFRACSAHHAAILCEGSTLKSTFADALTLFFCEAAGIMRKQGKPCLAYGSEVGKMNPYLARVSSDLCRDTWFITRTEASQEELEKLGLRGHIGTDTAWFYDAAIPPEQADRLLKRAGWDGRKPLLGIAVIDPFCWPVRASMLKWLRGCVTGNFAGRYDKWYFFSDSPERKQAYERYLRSVAEAVNRFIREEDAFPVLIGMERLDKKACGDISKMLTVPGAAFLAESCAADVMVGVLRRLSWLVTSRYHAAVLSVPASVPITAISMDERLDGLLKELEMDAEYLHHVSDENLTETVYASLRASEQNRPEIEKNIKEKFVLYQQKLEQMGLFLKQYIEHS